MQSIQHRHAWPDRFGALVILLCLAASVAAGAAPAGYTLVGEMLVPTGIVAAPAARRDALAAHPAAAEAIEALRARVAADWPSLRGADFVSLSRYHIDATRGWQPPVRSGTLRAQVIGHSEPDDALFLELRGPRLPASFEIVHRYVTVFARYRPASGELDRLTLTIRGEVLE